MSRKHWTTLEMFYGDRNEGETFGLDNCPSGQDWFTDSLREWRQTDSMEGVFFARGGAEHEDPDDASTWGPASPDEVDWEGFPERRYDGWKIVVPVLAGNLWSEPAPALPAIDRRASEDRYIEQFEKLLASEFPGAEISVEFNDHTEGSPPRPRVTPAPSDDPDDCQAMSDAVEWIDRLGQDIWGGDWYVERLYGLAEFAEALASSLDPWTKGRLWMARDRGLAPEPSQSLRATPVWTHSQVEAFVTAQREGLVLAALFARTTDAQAKAADQAPTRWLRAGGQSGAEATPEEIAADVARYLRGCAVLRTHALSSTDRRVAQGGLPPIEGAVAEIVIDAGYIATARVWTRVGLVPRKRADQTGLRPLSSAYDTAEGVATDRLLRAFEAAGHAVALPVTGAVIVNGIEIPYKDWGGVSTAFDGDIETTMGVIRERFGGRA